MKSSTITTPVLSVRASSCCSLASPARTAPRTSPPSPLSLGREERHTGPNHEAGRIPSCRCWVCDLKSQLQKARTRLRELLQEVQREKACDERMTAVKIRSRSRSVSEISHL